MDSKVDDFEEQSFDVLAPYFNWDIQISQCEEITELSTLDKQKAIRAFEYLRNALGEGFPIKVLRERHRMEQHFFNYNIAWSKVWFTWFAHSIEELAGSENFETVLNKIKSSKEEDFEEGISLLEYGLKLHKAGFTINFEKQIKNAKGQCKSPDIEVVDTVTSERTYVEVTRLQRDPQSQKYFELGSNIIHEGLRVNKMVLSYSGRIYRDLSNQHFTDIVAEINRKIKRAGETKNLQEILREGVIEFAIAPYNDKSLLHWAEEKGYPVNSFTYPASDILNRLKTKIKHKSQQASAQDHNILIIQHEELALEPIKPREWLHVLSETVYKCDSLLAVVIIGYEFGNLDKIEQSFGMDLFIQKTERYARGSKTLIIVNKFNKQPPITIYHLHKLIGGFIN